MHSLRVNRSAVIAACSSLFVISLLVAARGTDASHAGGMEAMSIDLDVAGNTATSLGPREECLVVAPGDTVTLDVTAEDIPGSSPMIGFQYRMKYPADVITVESSDANYLMASMPGNYLYVIDDATPDTDGDWNGMATDLETIPVKGSGVLERLTIGVSASAPSGVIELRLTGAFHIDTLNLPWQPGELRSAHLAVGTPCDGIPTFPPNTPPPLPVDADVGIDHDGPPADINTGPIVVPPGADFSAQLVAHRGSGGLDYFRAYVKYDPSAVEVMACGVFEGLHNRCSFGGGILGVEGLSEVRGKAVLADIGFRTVGADGLCTDLVVISNPEPVAMGESGQVCIDPNAPEPTPTPTPPPTPTPGPQTNTPTLGPPTTAATPTPTQSPASTATPSATPTLSAAPTAVPLAAALPATGGREGGADAHVGLLAAGAAALAAAAVWFLLRTAKRE